MAPTTQNSDTIEISDDDSDLYQEWDETKWIGAFLEARWLSEQNLKILANAISGPNILRQNLEILSEHIARIFGNFNMALSPIIGGPY